MLTSPLQVARTLNQVLGKTIIHVKLTEQEFASRLTNVGLTEDHARALASLEGAIKQGVEERLNETVLKVTGQPSRTFCEYAQASKSEWTL